MGKKRSRKFNRAGMPEGDPNKRQKKADPREEEKVDAEGFKPDKIKVTPEMFEAAKLMKTGIGHIKDLDYSVLKGGQTKTLQKSGEPGTAQVTTINI